MKDEGLIARIAGNILSGVHVPPYEGELVERDTIAVEWAVHMAIAVVGEVRKRQLVTDTAEHAANVKTTHDWLQK